MFSHFLKIIYVVFIFLYLCYFYVLIFYILYYILYFFYYYFIFYIIYKIYFILKIIYVVRGKPWIWSVSKRNIGLWVLVQRLFKTNCF